MRERKPFIRGREESISEWTPRTKLGKEVMSGKIISLHDIFRSGRKIKEPEIVDKLIPNLQTDIIYIGGSPGKGGGQRRTAIKRTARMHRSGRRYKISSVVIVGNNDGFFGIGKSTSLNHRTAIQKATQDAKLNVVPIKRGCGSWECACKALHSIPFEVEGKRGSVRVTLMPAPKGVGLAIGDEAKKILHIAGVKDIWSKTFGQTRTRHNFSFALYDAFRKMNRMKIEEGEMRQEIPVEVKEEKEEGKEEVKEEVKEKEEKTEAEEEKTKKKDEKKEEKKEGKEEAPKEEKKEKE